MVIPNIVYHYFDICLVFWKFCELLDLSSAHAYRVESVNNMKVKVEICNHYTKLKDIIWFFTRGKFHALPSLPLCWHKCILSGEMIVWHTACGMPPDYSSTNMTNEEVITFSYSTIDVFTLWWRSILNTCNSFDCRRGGRGPVRGMWEIKEEED